MDYCLWSACIKGEGEVVAMGDTKEHLLVPALLPTLMRLAITAARHQAGGALLILMLRTTVARLLGGGGPRILTKETRRQPGTLLVHPTLMRKVVRPGAVLHPVEGHPDGEARLLHAQPGGVQRPLVVGQAGEVRLLPAEHGETKTMMTIMPTPRTLPQHRTLPRRHTPPQRRVQLLRQRRVPTTAQTLQQQHQRQEPTRHRHQELSVPQLQEHSLLLHQEDGHRLLSQHQHPGLRATQIRRLVHHRGVSTSTI
jgi:hypothetical protein